MNDAGRRQRVNYPLPALDAKRSSGSDDKGRTGQKRTLFFNTIEFRRKDSRKERIETVRRNGESGGSKTTLKNRKQRKHVRGPARRAAMAIVRAARRIFKNKKKNALLYSR